MDSCVRGFTISHATIDYGAFNRTNFNTAMDHFTRLLIIRGINPLYGKSTHIVENFGWRKAANSAVQLGYF